MEFFQVENEFELNYNIGSQKIEVPDLNNAIKHINNYSSSHRDFSICDDKHQFLTQ